MTFDPGTWWLALGLLGVFGTVLGFFWKRDRDENDRTKGRVEKLEQTSVKKTELEKVEETLTAQGRSISHIEKTYVEESKLDTVRTELWNETKKQASDIEYIKENCLRKDDFLRQMMRLESMVTDINKYLREGSGKNA